MTHGSDRCVPRRDAAAAAPGGDGAPQRRCRATDGDVVPRRLGDLVRRGHGRVRLGGDRTDLPASGRVVLRLPAPTTTRSSPRAPATTSPTRSPSSTPPPPSTEAHPRRTCCASPPCSAARTASGRWCTVTPTRRDHRPPATSSSNSHPVPTSRERDERVHPGRKGRRGADVRSRNAEANDLRLRRSS